MKSLASSCVAVTAFCLVPVSAPPLAKGLPRPAPAELAAELAPTSSPSMPPPSAAAPTLSRPYSGPPPVTSLQILDIAKSAIGTRYVHGAESWATEAPARAGVDCSGLIAKAWQLPRAAESWEELGSRPTTETLNVDTSDWFKLPLRERKPGDALVRYEADVRHALIYERDEGDRVWVYEAALPRVSHRSYRLRQLRTYSVARRRDLDDVGLVGRSRDWVYGELVDGFRRAGGEPIVGMPYDRGRGVLAHAWQGGVAQDFHGGKLGEVRLVLTPSGETRLEAGSR
jgi:hypothetical protein